MVRMGFQRDFASVSDRRLLTDSQYRAAGGRRSGADE